MGRRTFLSALDQSGQLGARGPNRHKSQINLEQFGRIKYNSGTSLQNQSLTKGNKTQMKTTTLLLFAAFCLQIFCCLCNKVLPRARRPVSCDILDSDAFFRNAVNGQNSAIILHR